MNAESIAFLIDDANRFEANLSGFLAKLERNIDKSIYEVLEEQVKEIRKAIREFKDSLVDLEVEIQ